MFELQILVKYVGGGEAFRSVCPKGGLPYQFRTIEEAMAMARKCYPDAPREDVQVVPSTYTVANT